MLYCCLRFETLLPSFSKLLYYKSFDPAWARNPPLEADHFKRPRPIIVGLHLAEDLVKPIFSFKAKLGALRAASSISGPVMLLGDCKIATEALISKTFRWIPRSENGYADRVAKWASVTSCCGSFSFEEVAPSVATVP
ncbi:hypothetical protein L484_002289 [Morus notabilis]|uniref:RNase H type-1 domain-containing protein n=1 Tax=Morus notabilis TaxID=981085 RepID=W9QVZ5_9ROSA|nr:hypothetical protein L484_002289 [Morus notabilis]